MNQKPFNFVKLVAVSLVFWPAALWVLTQGYRMMNASSDPEVWIGIGLIGSVLVATAFWLSWIIHVAIGAAGEVLDAADNATDEWKATQRKRRTWKGPGGVAAAVIATSWAFTPGCACTRVDVGHVGLKVNMAGSNRGVDEVPMVTGWVFYNPLTERVLEYPIFVQTTSWTKAPSSETEVNEEVSFSSSEGMIVTCDVSLSYRLNAEKVPAFYVKFRTDDIRTFTHGFMRNVARDAFTEIGGTYPVEDVYGAKKELLIQAVRARVQAQIAEVGVVVEQFGFIGAPRPPDSVIAAINAKIGATQKAMQRENELREAEAAAKKRVAAAQGEADANRVLTESLSPKLLEWRQLEILERAIDKWDGRRPTVEGSGSGLLLELPIGREKAATAATAAK